MKFVIERGEKYISKLKKLLELNYQFNINKIIPGDRGLDGETWVVFAEKDKFFVKIDYSANKFKEFKKSLSVINYLNSSGIDCVNEIVKTKNNKNYIKFNERYLAVFKFIDGNVDYNYPYLEIIKLLLPIYHLKPNGRVIKKEKFKTKKLIYKLEKNIKKAKHDEKLNDFLNDYSLNIENYITQLKELTKKINFKTQKFITHGDACVNVMIDKKPILIDWDDVLIAPLERDCWFFMDYKYKIKNINNLLKKNGINYVLSSDLLAYYAYKSAIIYLNEDITKYLETHNSEIIEGIKDIFEGWVYKKISCYKNR